jgi:hypothetical protein
LVLQYKQPKGKKLSFGCYLILSLTRKMTATYSFPTLQELRQNNKFVFDKINYAAGHPNYRMNKVREGFYIYDYDCSINVWRFDGFITDAQWKTIALTCINFRADIYEVIRNLTFETSFIVTQDSDGDKVQYNYPTNIVGFIKDTYFLIEEDGRAHT